jgi:hypothetical protein
VFWSPDTRNIYASVGAPQGGRGRNSRSSRSEDQRIEQAYRTAAQTCRAGEPGLTQWPVEQIAQVVQPTPDQQKLLDDLKTASDQAIKRLQAACPTNQPSTPLGRLDAIAARLGAMLQAVDTVRPALASFFASLSESKGASMPCRRKTPGRPPATPRRRRARPAVWRQAPSPQKSAASSRRSARTAQRKRSMRRAILPPGPPTVARGMPTQTPITPAA